MTTVKKSVTKASGKRVIRHDAQHNQAAEMQPQQFGGIVTTGAAGGVESPKAKKLSTDERLEALIAFLKKHGLHFDGAAIEE